MDKTKPPTKYPYANMEINNKVSLWFRNMDTLKRARNRAHNIGCQKRWKFKTYIDPVEQRLEVTRIS